MTRKESLRKEHKELTTAIIGYIQDSKDFNFEPDDLEQMKTRLREVQKELIDLDLNQK